MLFSVTELQTYMRCKRKHYLTSFNTRSQELGGLTPIWPSAALHLGTLIHRVGEVWLLDPNTRVPLEDIFFDEAAKDLALLIRLHKDHNLSIPTTKESDYWEMVHLGKAMCTNYQVYYKTPLPYNFSLVQPEQEVVVDIPNTEHCGCHANRKSQGECMKTCSANCGLVEICCCDTQDGIECCNECVQSHMLSGTLDAIILDPTDRLFVFERKTYAARPNEKHLQRVWQFLAYAYLLRRTKPTLPTVASHTLAGTPASTSTTLGGIAYDGWWKRTAPPKGKTMHDLFYRTYMLRNPDEIDEFELDLTELALECSAALHSYTRPPRRTIPPVQGCIDCLQLIDVCDAISLNESIPLNNYVKRDLTPIFADFFKGEEA